MTKENVRIPVQIWSCATGTYREEQIPCRWFWDASWVPETQTIGVFKVSVKKLTQPDIDKNFCKIFNFVLEFRLEFWNKIECFVKALTNTELN